MNIKVILDEFLDSTKEREKILKEINEHKKYYKTRLQSLSEREEELSELILEYLRKNNLPGVEYKQKVFQLKEKKKVTRKYVNRKKKEETLINLSDQYNLSPEILAKIKSSMLGEEQSIEKLEIR